MKKIKVGIVNYLNTKPLLYGITHSPVMDSIELVQDYPSNIASLLLNQAIDIGLVPVVIIPELKEYHIYSDYCIGCDGPVASVCLFSEVPIEKVETILLDYQSRTSVALLKILLQEHWNVHPQLVETTSDYRSLIKGKTAGLIIGDRSLGQRRASEFVYDLGEAWKTYAGLPFVFAAWISLNALDEIFIKEFNAANRFGVENIATVIKNYDTDLFDMQEYFTNYISYPFDSRKKEGLKHFLKLL